MGNFSALIFLLLSFALPTGSPVLRRNPLAMYAAWLTLAAHHLVAFINAFVTPITSGWGDLYMFHRYGAGIYNAQAGYQPYGELLKVLYKLFGTSFWLGEVTSILCYSLSLLMVAELTARLGQERALVGVICLFGLPASPLAHRSVTMREVYQATSLLLAALALVRIRQNGPSPKGLLLLIVASLSMVYLHQSLAVFILAVWTLGIPWALRGMGGIANGIAIIAFFSLPVILPGAANLFANDSPTFRALEEGRLLNYAAAYREHVNEARSDYGVSIDTTSVPSFFMTLSAVVGLYFLAPLPWQMGSPIDLIALSENVLRMLLFFGALKLYLRSSSELKSTITLLFSLAFILELMWALGTTNWGTALRHHVPSHGLFVILGLPYWLSYWKDADFERLRRRQALRKNLQARHPWERKEAKC